MKFRSKLILVVFIIVIGAATYIFLYKHKALNPPQSPPVIISPLKQAGTVKRKMRNKKETARAVEKLAISNVKTISVENYIFTKLSEDKAFIRIYGVNTQDKEIKHFPVKVKYYAKDGKYLGEDELDLLSTKDAMLKAKGKIKAEVSVTYPEGTNKVVVDVK